MKYIQDLAIDLSQYPKKSLHTDIFSALRALAEETDRLDPRDFLPSVRYEFVCARMNIRKLARQTGFVGDKDHKVIAVTAKKLASLLESYGGLGSQAEQKNFPFIKDLDLKRIIERDYRELSLVLFPSGAWKSCVVLAGSILEAILCDILTSDSVRKAKALCSPHAPKKKGGGVKNIDQGEWTLNELIIVATDIDILPKTRANAIDQVLRDYRNFVHPKKEIKSQHPCEESEALLSKGALDAVINHVGKTI